MRKPQRVQFSTKNRTSDTLTEVRFTIQTTASKWQPFTIPSTQRLKARYTCQGHGVCDHVHVLPLIGLTPNSCKGPNADSNCAMRLCFRF